MFVLLFILIFVAAYLTTGAKVARSIYAREHRAWELNPIARTAQQVKTDADRALVMLSHKAYCNLNYNYLKKKGCDCDSRELYHHHRSLTLESSDHLKAEPGPPISEMFFWPMYVLAGYLTSGTVPETQQEAIARMERELKELEIS